MGIGHKDKQIRFWGQEVEGQGHSMTTYGEISTLGGHFVICLRNAWTYYNGTFTVITKPAWHIWHFQGHGLKHKQTNKQHFPKMHFSGGGIPIDGLPLNTICSQLHLLMLVFKAVLWLLWLLGTQQRSWKWTTETWPCWFTLMVGTSVTMSGSRWTATSYGRSPKLIA